MIKNNSIRASAAETLTLFVHFAFIIGDLVVHRYCPEWKIYLLMREIISTVFEKIVHRNAKFLLRKLISEHHELFLKTFRDQHLTPKMHFMLHYPEILDLVGPIFFLSTLRFESFHTIFKSVVKNIKCRKNIVKSCSVKIQMRYANLFLNFKSFKAPLKTFKLSKTSSIKLLKKYTCNRPLNEFVTITKYAHTNAATFKTGFVIQTGTQNDETPPFALIHYIILNDQEILLGCQKLINLGFDSHYYAYVVELESFMR